MQNIRDHLGRNYYLYVKITLNTGVPNIIHTGIVWKRDNVGPGDFILRKSTFFRTKDKEGIIKLIIEGCKKKFQLMNPIEIRF
jgi:hypothetical protein